MSVVDAVASEGRVSYVHWEGGGVLDDWCVASALAGSIPSPWFEMAG